MSPSIGSSTYGMDGSAYRLVREIGKGGQGAVWSLDGNNDLVAKFYHNGFSDEDVAKLSAMCRLKNDALSGVAAWPITLLKGTKSGKPQGLLMRKISGYQAVHQLYGMKSRFRTFPEAQFPFLLHSAINTARAFATIHNAGQVIGDVNHSNLMISQTATAALIDCDSFQITAGGQVFRCPVGVPEFTPPELQGTNFSAQARTPQHDAFGLSVLIFYLLFLGRHPFMGMYDPGRDDMVSLDQAIGQYAFPYALDVRSSQVKLPLFVPRLADYPSDISDLFKQAFTRDAVTRGRPSAIQWVGALTLLSGALRQCQGNPNHHFYNGLKECPWCRMEGVLGTPIFGIKVSVFHDQGFSLVTIWAEVDSIHAVPEALAKPDVDALASQLSPDAELPKIVFRRRKFRLGSLGIVVAVSIWSAVALVPLASVIAIVISLIVGHKLWTKGGAPAKPYLDSFRNASQSYKEAEAALDQSAGVPASFIGEKSRLEKAKAEFQDLGPQKAKRLAALQAGREQKQRQHFLERFRIEDATISGIGPKNKMILRTWGIEDAWDIEVGKVSSIKGFGPVKQQTLLAWRRGIEVQFRFDPRQPVDPRDLHALEQESTQKTQTLQNTLRSGPQSLRQALGVWQAQRRQSAARLHSVASELARARVNRKALRTL
jgi:DNA-binding helix-hairpin-helix protein with protein kinase domain